MNQRRQLVVRRLDAVAQLAQRLEQRRLRPLVHPRHAVQPIDALAQADHRRQKPGRGAGVAHKEFQRLLFRAARRDQAALAIDRDGAIARFLGIRLHVHHEPEFLQALDHHLRVLAPERALQGRFALAQRRQDQAPGS